MKCIGTEWQQKVSVPFHFKVWTLNKLYVNQNLTQRRQRRFRLAKQKAKELDYKFIWTWNGQIFIREDQKRTGLWIEAEYDLDSL